MSNGKVTVVSLPDSDGRHTWVKSGKGAVRIKSASGEANSGCYCLAAVEVSCLPIWVNSTDPELINQLIQLELEKHHLNGHVAGKPFDYREVDQLGPRRQLEVSVLPGDLTVAGKTKRWKQFNTSPRAFVFPSNQLVLWKELNQWVAAFSKGTQLAYYHPCGEFELDEDLLSELQCLYLELQDKELLGKLQGVTIWSPDETVSPKIVTGIKTAFGFDPEVKPRPEPDLARLQGSTLEPAQVALRRQAAVNRARAIRLLLFVALLFIGLTAAALWHIDKLEMENQKRASELEKLAPEAEQVQAVYDRWDQLRPSVDPARYPLELFHHCASVLPKKGVRLTHFEIDANRIVVRGEASQAALAIRYRNDLISLPELSDYIWESPPPDIQPDNRAKFRATGRYRYGNTQTR